MRQALLALALSGCEPLSPTEAQRLEDECSTAEDCAEGWLFGYTCEWVQVDGWSRKVCGRDLWGPEGCDTSCETICGEFEHPCGNDCFQFGTECNRIPGSACFDFEVCA